MKYAEVPCWPLAFGADLSLFFLIRFWIVFRKLRISSSRSITNVLCVPGMEVCLSVLCIRRVNPSTAWPATCHLSSMHAQCILLMSLCCGHAMAACPLAIKTYALCMSMQIVTYYIRRFRCKDACSSLRNFVFRLFQSLFHNAGLDLD